MAGFAQRLPQLALLDISKRRPQRLSASCNAPRVALEHGARPLRLRALCVPLALPLLRQRQFHPALAIHALSGRGPQLVPPRACNALPGLTPAPLELRASAIALHVDRVRGHLWVQPLVRNAVLARFQMQMVRQASAHAWHAILELGRP